MSYKDGRGLWEEGNEGRRGYWGSVFAGAGMHQAHPQPQLRAPSSAWSSMAAASTSASSAGVGALSRRPAMLDSIASRPRRSCFTSAPVTAGTLRRWEAEVHPRAQQ